LNPGVYVYILIHATLQGRFVHVFIRLCEK